MNNTNLPTTTPQPPSEETLAKISASWSQRGAALAVYDYDRETKVLAIIHELVLPDDPEKITAYEVALKSGRALLNELKADRIEKLRTLNERLAKCAAPEKQLETHLAKYAGALLAMKEEQEKAAAQVKAAADELLRIEEALRNKIAEFKAALATRCAAVIVEVYEAGLNALKTGEHDEVWNFLKDQETRLTEADFTFKRPNIMPKLNPVEAATEIANRVYAELLKDSAIELHNWRAELHRKFEGFEFALKNKQGALEAAKKVAQEETARAATNQAAANMENRVSTMAAHAEQAAPAGKALKVTYEIDCKDEWPDALKVAVAFIANFDLVKDSLRVKNPFNLSIAQMAAALAQAKSDGVLISVSGINFKEVKKL